MKGFFTLEDPRNSILIHAEEQVSIALAKNLNMRRINVSGAINVTDMCIKNKIGRMVYLSSAYALPGNAKYVSGEQFHFDRSLVDGDYAQTKAEASAYIMEKVVLNKYNAVLVLPTFMIGPGTREDSDIAKILDSYLNQKVAPINGGHGFIDVRDVAAGIISAAENGIAGAGYILTGEYRTTVEFLNDVREAAGVEKTDDKMFPDWALKNNAVSKFIDMYYKITHKTNPKDAYALFITSPHARYEVDEIEPKPAAEPEGEVSEEVANGEEKPVAAEVNPIVPRGISIKDSIKETVSYVRNNTGS
jgi:nucleoside-diphosphate-sugar epimerase